MRLTVVPVFSVFRLRGPPARPSQQRLWQMMTSGPDDARQPRQAADEELTTRSTVSSREPRTLRCMPHSPSRLIRHSDVDPGPSAAEYSSVFSQIPSLQSLSTAQYHQLTQIPFAIPFDHWRESRFMCSPGGVLPGDALLAPAGPDAQHHQRGRRAGRLPDVQLQRRCLDLRGSHGERSHVQSLSLTVPALETLTRRTTLDATAQ